jgi:hypothetical protein
MSESRRIELKIDELECKRKKMLAHFDSWVDVLGTISRIDSISQNIWFLRQELDALLYG